jgi:hypothetical protein
MADDPAAAKQRIIDEARDKRELPEHVRYLVVTELVSRAAFFEVPAEAEILEAAYGDPTGKDYWKVYLSEPLSVVIVAHLFAGHSASNPQELNANCILTMRAFRDAAKVGEIRFSGDTSPLLLVGDVQVTFESVTEVLVDVRAAVNWLLSKPGRAHLVPGSLRQYLAGLGSPETAVSADDVLSVVEQKLPPTQRWVLETADRLSRAGKLPVTIKGRDAAIRAEWPDGPQGAPSQKTISRALAARTKLDNSGQS